MRLDAGTPVIRQNRWSVMIGVRSSLSNGLHCMADVFSEPLSGPPNDRRCRSFRRPKIRRLVPNFFGSMLADILSIKEMLDEVFSR